jgi:hypothetical protein
MKRLVSRLLAVVLAGTLSGCGGDSLGGSLAQKLPLDFESARLQADAQALRLSYLRSTRGAPDIVFELVVLLDGRPLTVPLELSLAERLNSGQLRASTSRVIKDDAPLLPPITSGSVRLDRDLFDKSKLQAEFGLHFSTDASDRFVGLGTTVHGTFLGDLEQSAPRP